VSELLGLGRVAAWEDAAARIVRPYNASGDWTPEHEGYVPGTKIKQADVVLLGFPLEVPWVGKTTRANNLARYAAVTDPGGPAMTWGMHSVGYIELGAGYEAEAAANFNRSFANAQPPFLVWTETPTGGTPNFLTGAGGFLQTALQGYSGLRVGDAGVALAPLGLPEGARGCKIRGLAYLGARLDVEWDGSAVRLSVQAAAVAGEAEEEQEAPECTLCMAPAGRGRAGRRQGGRVAMGGGAWVVAQRALQVVDAAGGVHALVPGGAAVVLPLQALVVEAAAAR
jgi:trehalose/maltose hydrolase-like predicted phosphorylase